MNFNSIRAWPTDEGETFHLTAREMITLTQQATALLTGVTQIQRAAHAAIHSRAGQPGDPAHRAEVLITPSDNAGEDPATCAVLELTALRTALDEKAVFTKGIRHASETVGMMLSNTRGDKIHIAVKQNHEDTVRQFTFDRRDMLMLMTGGPQLGG